MPPERNAMTSRGSASPSPCDSDNPTGSDVPSEGRHAVTRKLEALPDRKRLQPAARVLVGSIGHESNTFAPYATKLDDFTPRYGPPSLDPPYHQQAYTGILDTLRGAAAELVPSVDAHALPGGRVEATAFEALKTALLAAADPAELDGVCLFLHGAMRAEEIDSCETDLLRALRNRLGNAIPISIALDMHGNVTAEMADLADAIVAFHTAPHIDEFETGAKAAEMLLHMLKTGQRPAIGFAKVPLLLPGELAQTPTEPLAGIMRDAAALEAKDGILSVSVLNAHCWADVPDLGVAAVVVADRDTARAQAAAERLAQSVWAKRAAFGYGTEAYPVAEAIAAAQAADEPTVFLSDSGDNPGAGGTTDVPVMLECLVAQGADRTLVAAMWDPEAVAACMHAGEGASVSLRIGGWLDRTHGEPLAVTGIVRRLWQRTQKLGADYPRTTSDLALIRIDGVDVLLSSERISVEAPEHLTSLGIDPLSYRLVVLKRGYLTAALEEISPRSILAISPGITCCDLRQFTFSRLAGPTYPLSSSDEAA